MWGADWRGNDKDGEAARSEEMILLCGIGAPLLSNGEGIDDRGIVDDGWVDGG